MSGVLLEYMDKHVIFLITSIFPLSIVFGAFFMKEEKREKSGENST
jgi:hypothetical protein